MVAGQALGDPRKLGEKLRAERESQDLTVQWVADRIGKTKQSVSAMENGQEPVGEDAVTKWIAALKLPQSWSLDWADWRTAEKMVSAGKIRFRDEREREHMLETIYRQLRGLRQ